MKLVDILARELKEWPEDHGCGYCVQAYGSRDVIFGGRSNYFETSEVAEDNPSARVTRAEWRAAVDVLNTECAHSESNRLGCPECGADFRKPQYKAPDWNGEGLPPVGMVCEYRVGNGAWYPCTIRYVTTPISDEEVQVVINCPHLNGDQIGGVGGGISEINFRLVRTPEQIAAEVRSAAADAIRQAVMDGPYTKHGISHDAALAIYDAGYRKFEIIDEPQS